MSTTNGTTPHWSGLTELASQITKQVSDLTSLLKTYDLPAPTISPDGPIDFPGKGKHPDLEPLRTSLADAARLLNILAQGPSDTILYRAASDKYDIAAVRFIAKYDIANLVPLDGTATYAEIAKKINLPEEFVRRMLRFAITGYVFHEPSPNTIAHTSLSKSLTDPIVRSSACHHIDDCLPGVNVLHPWLEAHAVKDAEGKRIELLQDVTHTPMSLAHGYEGQTAFEWFARPDQEERHDHFHRAMQATMTIPVFNPDFWTGNDIFKQLPQGTKIIDVGGSSGHVSMALARKHPQLQFVVQDLPGTVKDGEKNLPADMKDRIIFKAHDFTTPQTEKGDIYLLRFILHDWPDKFASNIVKNLLPAMSPSSRILIIDSILPSPGVVPVGVERMLRTADLQMMVCLNAKERTLEDWANVVSAGSGGEMEVKRIVTPVGSGHSVVEVGFR